ncbi:thioredoxin family protein [Comamonas aquatica]|uniref:protein-disulfide reductase DsbD family protein n=1 Tax=Comamonas aquatica TaxID=225991 RepID=UPI0022DD31AF|nr:thioredoxin family protein [Comamonas aquatica]MDH1904148.1 thioredoxin family protein [Comamonas aquatica]WBM42376.1 thioredoxin family protein [Comamonas aquatica]
MPISAPAFLRRLPLAWALILLSLLLVCGAALPTAAQAQLQLKLGGAAAQGPSDTVVTPRVRAQLVALAPEGIAPGRPLALGLRIEHQPDWHTYWKNAGDSGLPTQLTWQLPAGLQAGEIAWPVPQQIRVGDMLNYGYEGTVLLPVPLQVAPDFAPGSDGGVDIRLHASWLVCRVECIPEEGNFLLRLPASAPQTLWSAAFEAAHAQAPLALDTAQASASASDGGERLQLRVAGLPQAAHGQILALYPETADTLVHAAVLGQDWHQRWDGAVWTADVPLSPMRGEAPPQLPLVLGLPAAGTDVAHAPPAQAWRVQATVQQPWQAAQLASVSPALAAALAANQQQAAATLPASPAPSASAATWLLAVLGGLVGGLLLNLMPCVFPVLAIKVMGFARHGTDTAAQRRHGLAYAAGVVLSFLALGGVLLGLRAAGEQLGWGFQLQSPVVVAALAALFTLIGLNLAGVFEFGHVLPSRVANLHARHPLGDAFLSGVVAVAIASPCTAPFMGASLGFAVGLPAVQALSVFAALGVGMALPYVLVSWVPALLRWLPRPGAWMDTFRRAMAFPMFATVIWLVWVIGQQTGIDGAATLLALLLCLAALAWTLTLRGRTRAVLALLVLALAGWLAHSLGRNLLEPTPVTTATSARDTWQPWSPDAQAALLAAGRPVFVDYTAAWCVTCQVNKRTTLADAEVLADFARRNVALLRADWTRRDPAITQALAALGRNGVPVYVLLAPGQPPVVLTELLSRQEVHTALAQL